MSGRYLEILDFTQFFDHFVFTPKCGKCTGKGVKKRNSSECRNRTGSGGYVKSIHYSGINIDKVLFYVYNVNVVFICYLEKENCYDWRRKS